MKHEVRYAQQVPGLPRVSPMIHTSSFILQKALLLFGLGILTILGFLTFLPHRAHASVIIQRPLYIGLGSGLVGYWSFDGGDINQTKALDRSGQGNDGTLTNGATTTTGKLGQGFDG